ncbi:DUF2784 domain-containing protein [Thalassomonas haliotis]|uniref:DUF2784 domain-containing protein n=1 Tax=Thalassomonas haliotis TaxID=485448 RepID=A0ABY7V962_9GAMM|nr:DUF2784 domain-containing protein [Thalassomonas haliotis]WDE10174.1 DUF2784 domain-containing protein [Thalassomonas haliotis]
MTPLYHYLADTVLLLHFLFVVFVVGALLLILLGGYLGWLWVRNYRFRLVHLLCILVVVFQSWLGVICPVTTLEMWLRGLAGDKQYRGSFIGHWLEYLLYYRAPDWLFILVYSLFALLVVFTWLYLPPKKLPPKNKIS